MLGKESLIKREMCHSLFYDALTVHMAIVLIRYMLLVMEEQL